MRAKASLVQKLAELIPPGTVDAAANETGLNRSTLYKWLKGDQQPGAIDLAVLANYLGVKASDLIGDAPLPRRATPYDRDAAIRDLVDGLEDLEREDREELVRQTLWTIRRVRRPTTEAEMTAATLAGVIHFPTEPNASGDFPSPPVERWIEKDTDTPRELHAWVTPVHAEAAAGPPREHDDTLVPTAQLLHSLREIRDGRVKVVRIIGDSMYPTLRSGWKVLLDPSRALFQPGKIVMVYIRDEGTTIGRLVREGNAYRIVKQNRAYGGPLEIPLSDGEWYPVGTVTTIVEAPVEADPYRDEQTDGMGLMPGELSRHD